MIKSLRYATLPIYNKGRCASTIKVATLSSIKSLRSYTRYGGRTPIQSQLHTSSHQCYGAECLAARQAVDGRVDSAFA